MRPNDVADSMGATEERFEVPQDKPGMGPVDNEIPEMPVGGKPAFSFNFKDFLLTETGPDDDYTTNHPMNPFKSEGVGQIIRGVTGFIQKFTGMNSLKLAVLDIFFGWLKFSKERTEKKNESAQPTISTY